MAAAATIYIPYGISFATQAELNAAIATNGGQSFTGNNANLSPVEAQSRWPNAKLVQGGATVTTPAVPAILSFAAAITLSVPDPGFGATVSVPTPVNPGSPPTQGPFYTPNVISPALRTNSVTYNTYAVSSVPKIALSVRSNWLLHDIPVDFVWQPSFLPAATSVPVSPTQAAAFTGTLEVQVVSYTGDGTSARLIPTTSDLTKGVVAIWIQGGTTGVIDNGCFRANHAAMTGTLVMGFGVGSIQTTAGIMSFAAGGFTVTAGSVGGANFANHNLTKYTAIVIRDNTSDNRYLHTGRYTGNGTAGKTVVLTGATVPLPPTHVWVWGRGTAYRSTDFTGDQSVVLANAAEPITGVITSFGATSFVLGTNNNVNNNLSVYDYMTLSVDALFLSKHVFGSTKVTGTGLFPVLATFLFAPMVGFAREYVSSLVGAIWRGPDHVTTGSNLCANSTSNTFLATDGIVAIGAVSLSLGSLLAPAATAAFAWAWKTGTVDNLTPGTSYIVNPPPPTTTPGPPPNIVPPELGGAGGGCSATLAPGLDTGGMGSEGVEE